MPLKALEAECESRIQRFTQQLREVQDDRDAVTHRHRAELTDSQSALSAVERSVREEREKRAEVEEEKERLREAVAAERLRTSQVTAELDGLRLQFGQFVDPVHHSAVALQLHSTQEEVKELQRQRASQAETLTSLREELAAAHSSERAVREASEAALVALQTRAASQLSHSRALELRLRQAESSSAAELRRAEDALRLPGLSPLHRHCAAVNGATAGERGSSCARCRGGEDEAAADDGERKSGACRRTRTSSC